MKYDNWTPMTVSGSFQTVYSITGSQKYFHQAIWQADSISYDVQVIVNGEEIMNLDFEELDNDYRVAAIKTTETTNIQSNFDIIRYDTNRWIWRPAVPFEIENGLEIKMRANSGTVEVLRGIGVWRNM